MSNASENEVADFFPLELTALIDRAPEALEGLRRREVHLDLPDRFLVQLVGEERGHWAFLLQLHALVEGAIEHLIIDRLQRPELAEFIGHLNIGGRTGKQALCSMLGIFDDTDTALVAGLTELRNAYTHDVRMVRVPIGDYLDGLPNDVQRKVGNWVARAYGYHPTAEATQRALTALHYAPRPVLWHASARIIDRAYHARRAARARDLANEYGIMTQDGRPISVRAGDEFVVTSAAPDVDERPSQ